MIKPDWQTLTRWGLSLFICIIFPGVAWIFWGNDGGIQKWMLGSSIFAAIVEIAFRIVSWHKKRKR